MHRGSKCGFLGCLNKSYNPAIASSTAYSSVSLCICVVYLSAFYYAGSMLTMKVTYDNETPDLDKNIYMLAYDDDSLHTLFDSKSSSYDFTGDVNISGWVGG